MNLDEYLNNAMIFTSLIILCHWLFVVGNLDRGDLYFPAGKPFDLRCQNKTGGNFLSVFWYSTAYTGNGRLRTDIYRYTITENTYVSKLFKNRIERIKGTSLRISDSKLEDSGKWKCDIIFVINGDLKVTTLASYNVHIVSQPTVVDLSIERGSVLLLKQGETTNIQIPFCESQALSPFNISWSKVGGSLSESVVVGKAELKKLKGPSKHTTFKRRITLMFNNFTQQDAGQYKCTAENIGGKMSKILEVRMQKPTEIFSRGRFEIDVKVSGYLECKARGYPQMDFAWTVYPQSPRSYVINPGETYDDFTVSRTTYNSRTEEGSSRLLISKVKKINHGKYICTASTPNLKTTQDIFLTGKAPPDPPEILYDKSLIEENDITLFWKVTDDGGSPVTSIKIEFKNSFTLNSWMSVEVYDDPNKTTMEGSYTIQNLARATVYDFRIRASNSKGKSEYSDVMRMETKEEDLVPTTDSAPTDEPILDPILGSI